MNANEHFTGERFLPGVAGEIAYEHCHRYAFARRFVRGARVLDAACGEGYGAALLADVAASVVGIDVEPQVVADATRRYASSHANVRFAAASVTRLPLEDASVDAIVSFETIEHVGADDQRAMLAEFARVLAPRGRLVLSSPNRIEYSEARSYANPFHVKELDRGELAQLLDAHFLVSQWFCQRRYLGSAIWHESPGTTFEALSGSPASVGAARPPAAMYFVVVAARTADLPEAPALSLYADGDDAEWTRIDGEAREVLRLDALLRARDAELVRQVDYARELKAMVDARDEAIAARDARASQSQARLAELEAAIDENLRAREQLLRQIEAQERIIGYRESARWWCRLPVVRARRLWHALWRST